MIKKCTAPRNITQIYECDIHTDQFDRNVRLYVRGDIWYDSKREGAIEVLERCLAKGRVAGNDHDRKLYCELVTAAVEKEFAAIKKLFSSGSDD